MLLALSTHMLTAAVKKPTAPLILLMLICTSANAAMYSCADENGEKTLRSSPCKQEERQEVFVFRRNVPKETVKAFDSFQKGAMQGDAVAQNNLGVMYANGDGVPKDSMRAFKLFQKAAAQGYVEAQTNLGLLHYRGGEGIPKNITKALELFEKASSQGHAGGQFYLGSIYLAGKDDLNNTAKAVELFQKAAAQGYDKAQFFLGLLHATGDGVPKNAVKALELFQKAAVQGHVEAQTNLGILYYNGDGVPKNITKALELFEKAGEQGSEKALHYSRLIEEELAEEQRRKDRAAQVGSSCEEGVAFMTKAVRYKEQGVSLQTQIGWVEQSGVTGYWKNVFRDIIYKTYSADINPTYAALKAREIFCQ